LASKGYSTVNLTLILLVGFVAGLLLLLVWALRGAGKLPKSSASAIPLERSDRLHVGFLPQVRQALDAADYEFLAGKGGPALQQRVRRERRDVTLAYLSALRLEFEDLLRMARIIAKLSPEIVALQEFERLLLTAKFMLRYGMIRMKLRVGFVSLPQLDALGNLISGLSVRLEAAIKELGERAAHAAELASPPDRRGVGLT
jgi:hypothetical protein